MEDQLTTPPAQPTTVFAENAVQTPMSVANWVITLIITAIPLLGIIMLFVWAFGDNAYKERSNYAKAALILAVIGIVLSIVFSAIFGAIFSGLAGAFN
jgi:hypothetical protein